MIILRETEQGFERITGNPVIRRLDGEAKAPLRTILHESWTAKDRAAYGIYLAEPFTVPDGKRAAGAESFEMRSGKLVQVLLVEEAAEPRARQTKLDDVRAEIAALSRRVAALEGMR